MALNGPIGMIVVHCSASPDAITKIGVDEISDWHKRRRFRKYDGTHCGYHYVIRRDKGCKLEIGRKETTQGAHVKSWNHGSVGICIVGKKKFKPRQIERLFILLDDLMIRHGLTIHDVYGHRELTKGSKMCPNFFFPVTFATVNMFRATLEQWRASDVKGKRNIILDYARRCGLPYRDDDSTGS